MKINLIVAAIISLVLILVAYYYGVTVGTNTGKAKCEVCEVCKKCPDCPDCPVCKKCPDCPPPPVCPDCPDCPDCPPPPVCPDCPDCPDCPPPPVCPDCPDCPKSYPAVLNDQAWPWILNGAFIIIKDNYAQPEEVYQFSYKGRRTVTPGIGGMKVGGIYVHGFALYVRSPGEPFKRFSKYYYELVKSETKQHIVFARPIEPMLTINTSSNESEKNIAKCELLHGTIKFEVMSPSEINITLSEPEDIVESCRTGTQPKKITHIATPFNEIYSMTSNNPFVQQ